MTGMTRDEVLALPVAFPLQIAGRVWGWSRSRVYEHLAAGELPFPVVTIGNRYMVTREALLRSLGIDPATPPTLPRCGPEHERGQLPAELAAATDNGHERTVNDQRSAP